MLISRKEGNFGTAEAAEAGATAPSPKSYRGVFWARIALLAVAGLFIVLMLRRSGSGVTDPFARGAIVMALAAVLASEGLGRILFYALFRKDGL